MVFLSKLRALTEKVVTKVLWNDMDSPFKQKNYCEMIVPQDELNLTAESYINHYRAASTASDVGELIIYIPQDYSGILLENR